MSTAFFFDEQSFWHSGGNYSFMAPVGGLIQPATTGGLPENPETKRRLVNLMNVTRLMDDLTVVRAAPATQIDLIRVHTGDFLTTFKKTSDKGGGETGLRAPYGPGGYGLAALSAGQAKAALFSVMDGEFTNAYALTRPPGHHCLRDWQNGFCLLANIAIAVEAAIAEGKAGRVAVLDWDVHHGNGTEAIFYDRNDVLTISLHQERNYPLDKGDFKDRGEGHGEGANLNIPLPPGAGHNTWIEAIDRLAIPAIQAFKPDVIVIACGFDAAAFDPLGRMLCSVDTFRQMTRRVLDLAGDICKGRLVMAHEGGYCEMYVPFCGHATLQEMSGSTIDAADPFAEAIKTRQPGKAFEAFASGIITEMADALR